jgi:hypothetical protein
MTLSFVFTGHAMGQTGDRFENVCPSLNNAVSADLLQFLNGVTPDKENAWCVTWAIRKMGLERYEPAVVVLVRLLDFRRPPTEEEAKGFYLRSQSIDELFPAALALEFIGKPALSEVLRAIEAESTSATARENAVAVWMEIYKQHDEHPKAISLLKQAQTNASDDAAKQKLRWALQKALIWCNPPEEAACRQASTK